MKSNKLVKVGISHELLREIFTVGWKPYPFIETVEGLPPTAEFEGVLKPDSPHAYFLVFSDDSFEPVDLNTQEIPEQRVVFKQLQPLTVADYIKLMEDIAQGEAWS